MKPPFAIDNGNDIPKTKTVEKRNGDTAPRFPRLRAGMKHLMNGIRGYEYGPDDPKSIEANLFFERYLQENIEAAETLDSMRQIIAEFQKRAPRVIVSKCIDGRTHGSKGKGYPPTTITFSRTEGNNVDLSLSNHVFWNRIDRVVSDAERNKQTPALFIALAHEGKQGHSCAAHGLDSTKALGAVAAQAQGVREIYKPEEIYVLHGITNTDDMSERLIFGDGTQMNTTDIIEAEQDGKRLYQEPTDIFTEQFLDGDIDDDATARYVDLRKPRELLSGPDAPMYRDLQTGIAMETYLLREITRIVKHNGAHNTILQPHILKVVLDTLNAVKDLPESLKAPLAYQCIWNSAYALYQRRRLETMEDEEKEQHLEHAEDMVCYGEGFETLPRNKAILVKTGRGDDEDALRVAQKVLMNNRAHAKEQPNHPPLVHANVEISGTISDWNSLNDQVLSRTRTMLRSIFRVFEKDVRVLTTYSYKNQKMFFPVQISLHASENGDKRVSFPLDVSHGFGEQNFSSLELERRENAFAHTLVLPT